MSEHAPDSVQLKYTYELITAIRTQNSNSNNCDDNQNKNDVIQLLLHRLDEFTRTQLLNIADDIVKALLTDKFTDNEEINNNNIKNINIKIKDIRAITDTVLIAILNRAYDMCSLSVSENENDLSENKRKDKAKDVFMVARTVPILNALSCDTNRFCSNFEDKENENTENVCQNISKNISQIPSKNISHSIDSEKLQHISVKRKKPMNTSIGFHRNLQNKNNDNNPLSTLRIRLTSRGCLKYILRRVKNRDVVLQILCTSIYSIEDNTNKRNENNSNKNTENDNNSNNLNLNSNNINSNINQRKLLTSLRNHDLELYIKVVRLNRLPVEIHELIKVAEENSSLQRVVQGVFEILSENEDIYESETKSYIVNNSEYNNRLNNLIFKFLTVMLPSKSNYFLKLCVKLLNEPDKLQMSKIMELDPVLCVLNLKKIEIVNFNVVKAVLQTNLAHSTRLNCGLTLGEFLKSNSTVVLNEIKPDQRIYTSSSYVQNYRKLFIETMKSCHTDALQYLKFIGTQLSNRRDLIDNDEIFFSLLIKISDTPISTLFPLLDFCKEFENIEERIVKLRNNLKNFPPTKQPQIKRILFRVYGLTGDVKFYKKMLKNEGIHKGEAQLLEDYYFTESM